MDKKSKKIFISGMTCVSCEMIITEELKKIGGVHSVKVSRKNQEAHIFFTDTEPDFKGIKNTVEKLGYKVSSKPLTEVDNMAAGTWKDWVYSLLAVVALYGIYKAIQSSGFLEFLGGGTAEASLGAAILIGLVASVSSCLVVVGGVIVSFAAKYKTEDASLWSQTKPHLLFHAGRLVTFFFLGGLLGLIGDWLSLSNTFIGSFTVLVGFVLLVLGMNILGIAPSPSALGIRLPKKTFQKWNALKESNHALAPIALGALTFFLPCGFTQSMQLFAITTGSFLQGALSLFLFALGTAPVLIGLGVATTRFQNMKLTVFKKAAGFIVIIFAVYTFITGATIAGIHINWPVQKEEGKTVVTDSQQVIEMTVDSRGYTPNSFTLQKGVPVKWIIDGKQLTGCSNEIMAKDFNINEKLKSGKNIITFTPTKSGNFGFSCWMGMIRGKFIVK